MMKLHNLHDNRELVMLLLENWDYDADGLYLLDRFRISANAVYPFSYQDKVRFLRFAPVEEKREGQAEAEFAFLAWLDGNGYEAGQPVPSHGNRLLEVCATKWGPYQASVFEGVAGIRLDWSDLTDDAILAYGQALARLHELSSRYEPLPQNLPWSWEQVLEWSLEILEQIPVLPAGAFGPDSNGIPKNDYETALKAAREEAKNLRKLFQNLPMGPDSYGVVHYDFETDNVFWQQDSNRCVPIDFDDVMVHWHLADIAQALDSLRETVMEKVESVLAVSDEPVQIDSENRGKSENPCIHSAERVTMRQQEACDCFMTGYRSIRPISDEMLSFTPVFLRFTALYGYARVVRSLSEVRPDEPGWMANLRKKLHQLMRERREIFESTLQASESAAG